MAGYRGHIVGASVSFLILMLACSLFTRPFLYCATWLFFSIAGGLFPDIDIKSYGQMKFYKALFILILVLFLAKRWMLISMLSLPAFLPLCVHHRGLFHNFWFITALAFGATMVVQTVYPHHEQLIYFCGVFFVAGALSHLYLDLGIRRMFAWRF